MGSAGCKSRFAHGVPTAPSQGACVVCLGADIASHAAIPCGRQALCEACVATFGPGSRCPVCRMQVDAFLKVFVAAPEPSTAQRLSLAEECIAEEENRTMLAEQACALAEEQIAEVEGHESRLEHAYMLSQERAIDSACEHAEANAEARAFAFQAQRMHEAKLAEQEECIADEESRALRLEQACTWAEERIVELEGHESRLEHTYLLAQERALEANAAAEAKLAEQEQLSSAEQRLRLSIEERCASRLVQAEEQIAEVSFEEGVEQEIALVQERAEYLACERAEASAQALGATLEEQLVPSQGACVVCLGADIASHAAIPCGHQSLCEACAATLGPGSRCPICRTQVDAFLKVFVAAPEPSTAQRLSLAEECIAEEENRTMLAEQACALAEELIAEVEGHESRLEHAYMLSQERAIDSACEHAEANAEARAFAFQAQRMHEAKLAEQEECIADEESRALRLEQACTWAEERIVELEGHESRLEHTYLLAQERALEANAAAEARDALAYQSQRIREASLEERCASRLVQAEEMIAEVRREAVVEQTLAVAQEHAEHLACERAEASVQVLRKYQSQVIHEASVEQLCASRLSEAEEQIAEVRREAAVEQALVVAQERAAHLACERAEASVQVLRKYQSKVIHEASLEQLCASRLSEAEEQIAEVRREAETAQAGAVNHERSARLACERAEASTQVLRIDRPRLSQTSFAQFEHTRRSVRSPSPAGRQLRPSSQSATPRSSMTSRPLNRVPLRDVSNTSMHRAASPIRKWR